MTLAWTKLVYAYPHYNQIRWGIFHLTSVQLTNRIEKCHANQCKLQGSVLMDVNCCFPEFLSDMALSWEAFSTWMSTGTEDIHCSIMGAQHLPVSGSQSATSEEPELPSRQMYVLWNYWGWLDKIRISFAFLPHVMNVWPTFLVRGSPSYKCYLLGVQTHFHDTFSHFFLLKALDIYSCFNWHFKPIWNDTWLKNKPL